MNGLCPTAKKLCISVSCLDTPVLIKYCYSLLCSYSVCGQVNGQVHPSHSNVHVTNPNLLDQLMMEWASIKVALHKIHFK